MATARWGALSGYDVAPFCFTERSAVGVEELSLVWPSPKSERWRWRVSKSRTVPELVGRISSGSADTSTSAAWCSDTATRQGLVGLLQRASCVYSNCNNQYKSV